MAFVGTAPANESIKMDADAYCKAAHSGPVYTQDVEVNANGTLKDVFVYVKEGVTGNYPAPTTPVVLDQQGCQYHPHVFGIQAGQPLKIVNNDGTLHNIHALPKTNAEFNIGQPFKGMETVKKFDKAEMPVRFKCDVHKWMGAYAGVVNNPFFAVTNDQGDFRDQESAPGHLRDRGLAGEIWTADPDRHDLRQRGEDRRLLLQGVAGRALRTCARSFSGREAFWRRGSSSPPCSLSRRPPRACRSG